MNKAPRIIPTVLITRPEPDGTRFAEVLAAHGFASILEPLLSVHLQDPPVFSQHIQAVVATSMNGVRALGAAFHRTPLYCVGEGSATLAKTQGFTDVYAGEGSAESLMPLLEKLPRDAGPVLSVVGDVVRYDVAASLISQGFEVQTHLAYRTQEADTLSPATIAAFQGVRLAAATFFSPRTASVFARLSLAQHLPLGLTTAFCLSNDVAESLASCGFQKIYVAAEPSQKAMVDALQSYGRRAA